MRSAHWVDRRSYFSQRARARFFRRLALLAATVMTLLLLSVVVLSWNLVTRFGYHDWAVAVPLLFCLFLGAIVVSAGGGMRRFAFSLRSVMDAADRVADGDYSVRVREYGPPPMRALARSFNTMTTRLQEADRVRRDLMADVAHELRTPLTILQGRLEGLLDGVYERDDRQIAELVSETHVLSRLIDDLRTLALADAGALPLQQEATDLAALARDTARSLAGEAAAKGVALTVSAPQQAPLTINLDPLRIREVLVNLLSNAVRHTGNGGAIILSLALSGRRSALRSATPERA